MSDLLGKEGLQVVVGEINWDPSTTDVKHDLDLVALLCQNGKVPDKAHIITGNSPSSEDSPIQHTGDNQTGMSEDGDEEVGDEQVHCYLGRLTGIDKIAFAVVTNGNDITFDTVRGASFRMFDAEAQQPLLERNLTRDSMLETAVVVGELVLKEGAWELQDTSFGSSAGIEGIADYYGLSTE